MSGNESDIYLSYSGRKMYLVCPKQYRFKYIQKIKPTKDPKHTMFGSSIGRVFEWFYSQRFWSKPDPLATTLASIPDAMNVVFAEEGFNPAADPDYVSKLTSDLHTYVPNGVAMIRDHKLLTTNSRAEVDLSVTYASTKHNITIEFGGRADFIHEENGDVWIMDGKGSRHREKFTDPAQLVRYALQHYLKYGVAPSRLGFMYYMFPDNPVTWISYDNESVRNAVEVTFAAAKKILADDLPATPSGECHRCSYKGSCEEGRKYLAKRKAESSPPLQDSIFDIDFI